MMLDYWKYRISDFIRKKFFLMIDTIFIIEASSYQLEYKIFSIKLFSDTLFVSKSS